MTGIDNRVFIDRDGVCKTKLYKDGVHYDTIISDRETASAYRVHLNRVSLVWKVGDDEIKVPRAGSTTNNRTEASAFRPRPY